MRMCESGKHDLDSYLVPKLSSHGKEICRGCYREADAISLRQRRFQKNKEEALASIASGEVRMCRKGLHDMNKQVPIMWGPRGRVRCRACYGVVQAAAHDRRSEVREDLAGLTEDVPVMLPFRPVKWQDDAACQEFDPELFFDDERDDQKERRARRQKAKQICQGCLVREECLQYALEGGETEGVWGGLDTYERARLRKQQLTRDQLVLVS